MDERYRIRPASPADAPALSAIERRCFSDPWSSAGFREAIAVPGGFGLIVERPGPVIAGYLLGRQACSEGEVLNLAVDPPERRRGLGAALLREGLEYLTRQGVEQVFLEVRESNQAALRLYQSHGFRVVGMRSGYYRNPPENAVVLRRDIERDA
jgi:ribosomal-protein-alanine N-acetyltransferase